MIWACVGGEDGRLVESQPNLNNRKKERPQGKQDSSRYQWQNEARKPWEDASFALSTNTAIYPLCLILISYERLRLPKRSVCLLFMKGPLVNKR